MVKTITNANKKLENICNTFLPYSESSSITSMKRQSQNTTCTRDTKKQLIKEK